MAVKMAVARSVACAPPPSAAANVVDRKLVYNRAPGKPPRFIGVFPYTERESSSLWPACPYSKLQQHPTPTRSVFDPLLPDCLIPAHVPRRPGGLSRA
jgi:hypothetical protein